MLTPPLGRRQLDARVLRGAALMGSGVQQRSPSNEEVGGSGVFRVQVGLV